MAVLVMRNVYWRLCGMAVLALRNGYWRLSGTSMEAQQNDQWSAANDFASVLYDDAVSGGRTDGATLEVERGGGGWGGRWWCGDVRGRETFDINVVDVGHPGGGVGEPYCIASLLKADGNRLLA